MFSRLCKLSQRSADISVINLRSYRISPILLQESDNDDKVPEKVERIPIILCKRPQFNFYKGKTYSKFETIPLASQGWHHTKSGGDYFTIYPYDQMQQDEDFVEEPQGFEQFDLHPKLIENLSFNNIHVPTEIQINGIPQIFTGQHTVLSAETGCGKTFTYLLPLLDRIVKWKTLTQNKSRPPNNPYGLIITPSRELAEQIGREAIKVAKGLGLDIKVIIGGRTTSISKNPSVRDVDLLIGTFGVVSKMTTYKIYKLNYVRHVVLDEAHALFHETFDEKLDYFLRKIHFSREVMADDSSFPNDSQLTLVSATKAAEMPEYMKNVLDIKSLTDVETANLHRIMVPQKFMRVVGVDKPMALLKLVKPKAMKKHPFIVFSNDHSTCDWISMYFNEFGIRADHLNGEMPMAIRKGKFAAFQNGEYTVLSTTNAGSRGLDTVNVNDVVNYDFPMETADYIHRCGRTGRIGARGDCRVTNLISRRLEIELTQKIERAARRMRALPIFNMLEESAKREDFKQVVKGKTKSEKKGRTSRSTKKSEKDKGQNKTRAKARTV